MNPRPGGPSTQAHPHRRRLTARLLGGLRLLEQRLGDDFAPGVVLWTAPTPVHLGGRPLDHADLCAVERYLTTFGSDPSDDGLSHQAHTDDMPNVRPGGRRGLLLPHARLTQRRE